MLAYREATGSAEVHEHEADIFVVESGEATIVTGGKLVDGHAQKPGEIRGTSIDGGERHPLAAGDIIHIPAGVPHQPANASQTEPLVAIIARTDPNEQESVVVLPDPRA